MSTQEQTGAYAHSSNARWPVDRRSFFLRSAANDIIRRKETWAGVPLARAFDPNTPWAFQQQAQIRFYKAVHDAQRAAVALMAGDNRDREPVAKPQLSAFFTGHPAAAQVAIGHTAFLEVKAALAKMRKTIQGGLTLPSIPFVGTIDKDAVGKAMGYVTDALANRQAIHEAAQHPELRFVEHYRLFQASHTSLAFPYLTDIIRAIVIWGDVMPALDALEVHPMTRRILDALAQVSHPFWSRLEECTEIDTTPLFIQWGNRLIAALLPFMPPAKTDAPEGDVTGKPDPDQIPDRFGPQDRPPEHKPGEMPPLNDPPPPKFQEPEPDASPFSDLIDRILDKKDAPSPSQDGSSGGFEDAVRDVTKSARDASDQHTKWEDMREDLLAAAIARAAFEEGPLEGSPTEGNNLELDINGQKVAGAVYDRCVELTHDIAQVDALRNDARETAAALRRNLYPSIKELPETQYAQRSGQLDPKRLPIADAADAVFRRHRITRQPDPEGRALLVIAADGSASLSNSQMRMCKILTAAWLESTQGTLVRLLACLYNSDRMRTGRQGPLVRWIYHPVKTPVMSPRDAIRAVTTLPGHGEGAQSDALSLAHVLDEAAAAARGSHVYLVIISDCAWNKCFPESDLEAEREVAEVLKAKREALNGFLNITLVSLSAQVQPEIEEAVDHVVLVQPEALENPASVAAGIGEYVASCIRERRKDSINT